MVYTGEMTIPFDTHAAAKELERAGFTEAQVDALVEVTRRTITLPDISDLATKTDIAGLKADFDTHRMATKADIAGLKGDFAALKADFDAHRMATKADIAEVRTEIAGLRTEIASAKLQGITIILSGMALITALGTILSKLIH
jgi:hypothetical protein